MRALLRHEDLSARESLRGRRRSASESRRRRRRPACPRARWRRTTVLRAKSQKRRLPWQPTTVLRRLTDRNDHAAPSEEVVTPHFLMKWGVTKPSKRPLSHLNRRSVAKPSLAAICPQLFAKPSLDATPVRVRRILLSPQPKIQPRGEPRAREPFPAALATTSPVRQAGRPERKNGTRAYPSDAVFSRVPRAHSAHARGLLPAYAFGSTMSMRLQFGHSPSGA